MDISLAVLDSSPTPTYLFWQNIVLLHMTFSTHLRWCLILTAIIATGSMLLLEIQQHIVISDFLVRVLRLFLVISANWAIYRYFIQLRLKESGHWWHHLIGFFLGLLSTILFTLLFENLFPDSTRAEKIETDDILQFVLIFGIRSLALSLICFATAYSIITAYALQKTKLENEQLHRAHLDAKLGSLQQQISPHFLFNSLSTLKSMLDNPRPKEYIVKLSACYRYVLGIVGQHLTTLEQELEFAKAYLFVLNERFEDSLDVTIEVDPKDLSSRIPPLCLQLLIENAVKHNIASETHPLTVLIRSTGNSLVVKNNYQPKISHEERTGAGLNNIIERYELLRQPPVQIENTEGWFTVTLPLISK